MDSEQKDLRLKFTAFDLEESVDCTADYVVIRDGKEKTSPLIGNYIKKPSSSLWSSLGPWPGRCNFLGKDRYFLFTQH